MNRLQKEVQQAFIDSEKSVLKELEASYRDALIEIDSKLSVLLARQDVDLEHVIYQVEHQKALRTQVQSILEGLQAKEFETLSGYFTRSYTDGFLGTMYDIKGQGIPLIIPIDQKQVLAAIQHETKLSSKLYTELGHDIGVLQKNIAGEISRGIASGMGYPQIARNIANYAKIPKNRAMTIARTESHRIQCKATSDAQFEAKKKGADVVKQWDAALDGDTRPNHRQLDGQIRELEERFEVGKFKPRFPGDFGNPGEDCNCRCALLQRARWALDESELETLKERAAYFGLDKTKDFEEYKKKYLKATENLKKQEENGIIEPKYKEMLEKRTVLKNSDLKNGLPLEGIINSIMDKTDDSGKVLQRRVYGDDGKAKVDFDINDHGLPHLHPTGAHKNEFDYSKKNPHGKPQPLTEQELINNADIIKKGENYHDN